MKLARWIYAIAGIYGILVLAPQLFMEQAFGLANPPAVTHPEFYYGFIASALVWQVLFLLIAYDPIRFRILMPITFLEKIAFALPVLVLFLQDRVGGAIVLGGAVDGILLLAFLAAYRSTPKNG